MWPVYMYVCTHLDLELVCLQAPVNKTILNSNGAGSNAMCQVHDARIRIRIQVQVRMHARVSMQIRIRVRMH